MWSAEYKIMYLTHYKGTMNNFFPFSLQLKNHELHVLKEHILTQIARKKHKQFPCGRNRVILDDELVMNVLRSYLLHWDVFKQNITQDMRVVMCHAIGTRNVTARSQDIHSDHSCGYGKLFTFAFRLDQDPIETQFVKNSEVINLNTNAVMYDAFNLHKGPKLSKNNMNRIFISFSNPFSKDFSKIAYQNGHGIRKKYVSPF